MSAIDKNLNLTKEPSYYMSDVEYQGELPRYHERSEFEWVPYLENNYEIIKEELINVIQGNFAFKKNINPPAHTNPDDWTNMYFYNFLWRDHDIIRTFPKTNKILASIPGIIFAGIAVLKPQAEVKPHTGETDATIRCHLGIDVPGKLPECGMCVGGEERSWENGKVILFSDAYTHSTWNFTEKNRVVILFDVVRNEYINRKYEISCKCLASLSIKALRSKYNFLLNTEGYSVKFLHQLFYVFWYLFLPIQRNILKSKKFSP